ncbi:MFS transporter [Promineifilum sp.]|uniref:MFS transporter n=1 Tax=Promineifilum sp. TaxID=2664178 RepID=UPI0035AF094F
MAGAPKLTTGTKFIFGLGDWGTSAAATARNIFWFIFLTNVVGLDAGLAGFVVLIGRVWDSINDPLVGSFSDRMRSRWGRRRPFLLFGSIPFALSFFLMFYVPPWQSDAALIVYYSVAFLLFDTLYTIVNVPYLAMVPELTTEYDERSSLTGWRIAFSILAALITAGAFKLLAENVFAVWLGGGPAAIRQGYMLSAGLWSLTIAIPYLLVFRFVREPDVEPVSSPIRPLQNFREVYANRPFLLAALIYLLCFTTGDIILVVLVRYLIDYIRVTPGFDSVVLVMVLGMALLSTPFVVRLMQRTDKRTAYLITIGFMTGVLIVATFVPPGAQNAILIGAGLAGIGYAAMSVIPWAIVGDVIEADELKTGERREGLYSGFLVLLRKWASAFAIFAVGRLLSETGFISSTTGSLFIEQPESALNAMRFLVSIIPAVALGISLVLAWRFPIDRERYEEIRRQLDERRQQSTSVV